MTEWVLEIIARGGYWGIALLMAVENVFPPIPSELIMGLGGINVARGAMAFWPVLIAGTLGSTAGNMVWYEIGRAWGVERLRPFIARWGRWLTLDWSDVEYIVAFFRKHGHHVVFWLRFSPFLRTMISLPAGMARMNRAKFAIFTMAGAAIWNTLLLGAGYYLGTNFKELERYTGPVAIATLVIVVAAYLYRVATWSPSGKDPD